MRRGWNECVLWGCRQAILIFAGNHLVSDVVARTLSIKEERRLLETAKVIAGDSDLRPAIERMLRRDAQNQAPVVIDPRNVARNAARTAHRENDLLISALSSAEGKASASH